MRPEKLSGLPKVTLLVSERLEIQRVPNHDPHFQLEYYQLCAKHVSFILMNYHHNSPVMYNSLSHFSDNEIESQWN